MKTINISLTDSMEIYVEQQIIKGGYNTIHEYFEDLIRQDQKRQAQAQLESMLIQGIESGPSTEMTAANWQEIRQIVNQHLAKS